MAEQGQARPQGNHATVQDDVPAAGATPAPGADEPDEGDLEQAPDGGNLQDALEQQVAELEERWRRALADLDNFRKRVGREQQQMRQEERARVAKQWLPILDNLELALQHSGADPQAIVEGVRAVRDQALEVMARLGFPQRDDVGATFDPERHEAVSSVVDESAPAGTVVHVVRPGYGEDSQQLRPASVVVATKGQ
jgi:molecular chaperone GrpE